jgi:hypothetical protein
MVEILCIRHEIATIIPPGYRGLGLLCKLGLQEHAWEAIASKSLRPPRFKNRGHPRNFRRTSAVLRETGSLIVLWHSNQCHPAGSWGCRSSYDSHFCRSNLQWGPGRDAMTLDLVGNYNPKLNQFSPQERRSYVHICFLWPRIRGTFLASSI